MFGFFNSWVIDDRTFKAAHWSVGRGEYVDPHTMIHRIKLRYLPVAALLVAVLPLATLTACGPGGGQTGAATGESTVTTVTPSNTGIENQSTIDSFTISYDEYGLIKPNFFYSINADSFWSIQADVADSVWDPDCRTVVRIDIHKHVGTDMPPVGGKTFAIESNAPHEKFPGSFLVFNGQLSTRRRVEAGTISFSLESILSSYVSGSYNVLFADHDSATSPAPRYRLMGTFIFKVGTYNAAIP